MPPFEDRLDLARQLQSLGFKTGVELGVRRGDFSAAVLGVWPASRYVLVDAWMQLYSRQYVTDRFDQNLRDTLHKRIVRGGCTETFEAAATASRCGTVVQLCRNWTHVHVCAQQFSAGEFDFVYVDALHDYKGALRDISIWWPKLRPGGIMAGHDYMDVNSSWADRGDLPKLKAWRTNYDGSREPTGKLVKGAVDDFFSCRWEVDNEHVVAPNNLCGHRRQVTVATRTTPWKRGLASRLTSRPSARNAQDVYPPTWAVVK